MNKQYMGYRHIDQDEMILDGADRNPDGKSWEHFTYSEGDVQYEQVSLPTKGYFSSNR